MSHVSMGRGRSFSDAARAAALARRREIAANKQPVEDVRVFVTRVGTAFGWEIRRFGALVIARSKRSYASNTLAREAGFEALSVAGQAS